MRDKTKTPPATPAWAIKAPNGHLVINTLWSEEMAISKMLSLKQDWEVVRVEVRESEEG